VPAASAALLPSTRFAVLCLVPMEKRVVEDLQRRFFAWSLFSFHTRRRNVECRNRMR
jgi:hypothetical protein